MTRSTDKVGMDKKTAIFLFSLAAATLGFVTYALDQFRNLAEVTL